MEERLLIKPWLLFVSDLVLFGLALRGWGRPGRTLPVPPEQAGSGPGEHLSMKLAKVNSQRAC